MKIFYLIHSFIGKDYYHGVGVLTIELIRQLEDRHEIIVVERSVGDEYGIKKRQYRGVKIYTLTTPAPESPILVDHAYSDDAVLGLLDEILEEEGGCHLVNIHHMISWPTTIAQYLKSKQIPVVLSVHDTWFACPAVSYYNHYHSKICDKPTRTSTPNNCESCLKKRGVDAYGLDMPLDWYRTNIVDPRKEYVDLWSNVDAVVYPTKKYTELYAAEGFNHPSTHIIPYFIQIPEISKRQHTNYVFGFISNLSYGKGAELVLAAFSKIPFLDIRLQLYGSIHDSRTKLFLEDAIRRDSRISYHGIYDIAAIGDVLADVDCVVVPSIYPESFNLCSYASVCTNTPLIVSDVAYHEEFLSENVNCTVFKSNDTNSLTQALRNTYISKQKQSVAPFCPNHRSFGDSYHELYTKLQADSDICSDLSVVIFADKCEMERFEGLQPRIKNLSLLTPQPDWANLQKALPAVAESWSIKAGSDESIWELLKEQISDTLIVLSGTTISLEELMRSVGEIRVYEFFKPWKKISDGVFYVTAQHVRDDETIAQIKSAL